MSRRITDVRGEKAMCLFLDKYFYPRIFNILKVYNINRVYDKEMQKKGADIILKYQTNDVIVDEKAQLYYINNPKQTFAFEINYYNEKIHRITDGWLVNNNQTQFYLLLWIHQARTHEINRIVADDFSNVEAFYISKKKIIEYIDSIGYSVEKLKEIADDIRNGNIKNAFHLHETCFIFYSQKGYDEKPINLIISKKCLQQLSEHCFTISKEAVLKL